MTKRSNRRTYSVHRRTDHLKPNSLYAQEIRNANEWNERLAGVPVAYKLAFYLAWLVLGFSMGVML